MPQYPNEHKTIVKELLDGRFLIYPDMLFITLQENRDFYEDFFINTFDYKLELRTEFAYLTSSVTTEKETRDFTIFLALLCRELELEGKKFREQIDFATFRVEEIEQLLKNSSKKEVIESTGIKEKDFRNFLNRWNRKNVITLTGNSFKFTKAVNLFFEFAVNVANEKLKETTPSSEVTGQ